jgi:hypothetical protein
VNLSEYFWVKMLHTKLPTGTVGKFVRELPGIILVALLHRGAARGSWP